MKNLHFDYNMTIEYSEPVSSCHFTIKCIPGDTPRQLVEGCSVELSPDVSYETAADSFGNLQIYGADYIEHTVFRFHIFGDVQTGMAAYDEEALQRPMIFCHPYGLNRPGEELKGYWAEISAGVSGQDAPSVVTHIMHSLHRDFKYEKGVTAMKTGAGEAWRTGGGVCQDYAHILISMLHMNKIPARYVTGMMIGEGESHAWVEYWDSGKWYGIDPTNDKAVGDEYIRLGCGRDATDCLINRGIMHGGGSQKQTVRVMVSQNRERI